MNIVKRGFVFFVIKLFLLFGFFSGNQIFSEPAKDSASAEEYYTMLDEEVEHTSSKKEIKLSESAASISVISREDIDNSWATNIPDLLRNVAGVDVIGVSAGTHMVSMRGANPFSSLKVGMLIDGQTVEPLIYGTNTWNQIPVSLADIERIEIVKSPGGVLYGANALYGVINIITQKPSEKPATTLSYTYGDTYDTKISTVSSKGKVNNFGYRIGINDVDIAKDYSLVDPDKTLDRQGDNHTSFNALFTYSLNKNSDLEVAVADNNYEHWNRLPDRLCSSFISGNIGYARINYNLNIDKESFFRTGINYERSSFNYTNNGLGGILTEISDEFVPDFTKSLATLFFEYETILGDIHNIMYGIEAQKIETKNDGINPFFTNDINENLYAIYIQDRVTLSDDLQLHLGFRVSDHYITDVSYSPSLNLVYKINDNNNIKFSAMHAVREPNIYETNMNFNLASGFSAKYGLYKGNEDVEAEKNDAFSITYQYLFYDLSFEGSAFLYDGDDFFDHAQVGNTVIDDKYVPVYEFNNYSSGKTYGLELGTVWIPANNFKLFLNTTYQKVDYSSIVPISPNGRFGDSYSPEYKINAGFFYHPFDWLKTGIAVNYVDEVTWQRYNWNANTGTESVIYPSRDSYTNVNLNINIIPLDFVTISLKINNLFDDEHKEWPISSAGYTPRNVLAECKVSF